MWGLQEWKEVKIGEGMQKAFAPHLTFLSPSPAEEGIILLSVILPFCRLLSTTDSPKEEDFAITGLSLGTALVSSSGPCDQKVHATPGHSVALVVFLQTAYLDRPLLRVGLASPSGATSFCHPSLSLSGQMSDQDLLSGLIIMCSVGKRRHQILPWKSRTRALVHVCPGVFCSQWAVVRPPKRTK